MTAIDSEAVAIAAEAQARLIVLRRQRALLWADRDDAEVMSALTTVESEIRAAERALDGAADQGGTRNPDAESPAEGCRSRNAENRLAQKRAGEGL